MFPLILALNKPDSNIVSSPKNEPFIQELIQEI